MASVLSLTLVAFIFFFQACVNADVGNELQPTNEVQEATSDLRVKRAIKQSGRVLKPKDKVKTKGRSSKKSKGRATDSDKPTSRVDSAERMDESYIKEISDSMSAIQEAIRDAQSTMGVDSNQGGGGNLVVDPPREPMPQLRDTSIPIPQYNSMSMTPATFLIDAEEYLTMQGVPKPKWHILAGHFFYEGSDQEQWYYAHQATYRTWKAFKTAFTLYETTDMSKDILTQQLYTRRQRRGEAFESFAWRMYALYKRVKPAAKDKEIIDRILHSCLPRIADVLIPLKAPSVVELVKMARKALGNMNNVRRYEHLPSYRIRKSDNHKYLRDVIWG